MSMNNIRLCHADDFTQSVGGEFHLSQQARALDTWRTVKSHAIDIIMEGLCWTLLRCRQVEGFPSKLPLFTQNGERAKGVAAVQRDGVIQDVEDAQAHTVTALGSAAWSSTTCRKKASNISSAHSGAL